MAKAELTIVGGPNGAGKTTLARDRFSSLIARGWFIDAD
jgi:predicted ABC-type ATPase